MTYSFYTNSIKLINEINLKDELLASETYEKQQRVELFKNRLSINENPIVDYEKIIELGKSLGEYVYACFETKILPDENIIIGIDKLVDKAILNGCLQNSFYTSETNIKTVNKILPYIKYKKLNKIALICFDGMGVAEWYLLKGYLNTYGFSFSEKFLFALIPTITKISRSSIYYNDYISVYSLKTPNEEKQIKEYFKSMTCKFYRERDIKNENTVLGIDFVSVIYTVFDDYAHNTMLPPGEKTKFIYFNNMLNYLEKSPIKNQLVILKNLGYPIFICSDHGCVVAEGNGQQVDKYLIESSSKRSTLITKTELSKFYDVNHYKIPFLSDEKVALLSKNRTMFAPKGITEISHGGITLDELIVPFIEVN